MSFINFWLSIWSNLESLKIICVLYIHIFLGLHHQNYSDHIEGSVAAEKACIYEDTVKKGHIISQMHDSSNFPLKFQAVWGYWHLVTLLDGITGI